MVTAEQKARLDEAVWVSPQRMSGTPCFRGTRVPVQSLIDFLEGGETIDQFLALYPGITRQQVVAVLSRVKADMTLDNYKMVLYRNQPDGWVAEVLRFQVAMRSWQDRREEALAELEGVFQMIAADVRGSGTLAEDTTSNFADESLASSGFARGRVCRIGTWWR